MLTRLLFVLIISLPSWAYAQEKITPCAIKNGRAMAQELNQRDLLDKIKHCSVTCVVTIRCSAMSARALGYAKELMDVFGEGNAEFADLVANELGILLAETQRARNKLECIEQCSLHY